MRNNIRSYCLIILVLTLFLFSACSSSKTSKEENETTEETTEELSEEQGMLIMNIAKEEQENEMYSRTHDSTILYWLDDKVIILHNQTKCNIFALNVLFKAGFKTPSTNALTRDLIDTSKFKLIFPVVAISEPESARKGDLIVWNGHVIIFDYLKTIKNDFYAVAWWAGTRQADNGDNIINNVCYGKYKLSGYYVIRRPVKR
jgi:hypothetical protein